VVVVTMLFKLVVDIVVDTMVYKLVVVILWIIPDSSRDIRKSEIKIHKTLNKNTKDVCNPPC